MKKIVWIMFLLTPIFASATGVMSPEKSRCRGMQIIAREHNEWKTKFSAEQSIDVSFGLKFKSLENILKAMNSIKEGRPHLTSPDDQRVLVEAVRLYQTLSEAQPWSEHYKASYAEVLNRGRKKLSDIMDNMLRATQPEFPGCDFSTAAGYSTKTFVAEAAPNLSKILCAF